MPDCPANRDHPPPVAYEPPNPERAAAGEVLPVLPYQAPQRHDPYAAMRFRDFRFYSVGWLFSTVGYLMQSTAIIWEINQWTHSPMNLGLAGGIQAIPLILLALPAGHVADLYDRKRIAIVSAILSAFVSLALALLSCGVARGLVDVAAAIPLLYGLIFTGAIVNTFTRPARAALLPQIVPANVFSNAVTWNSTIFEVSSMAGPALAGWIIWLAHPSAVFAINVVFSVVFLSFLLLLHHRPTQRAPGSPGRRELMAGLRFVWRTKIILATITLDLFAVLLGGATYLLPIFADRLGIGPVGFAYLRAAPAVGSFSMALLLAHRAPMRHAGRSMLLAVTGFGLAIIAFGLSHWFWVSIAALLITGALDNISVVVRHTLVQLLTPDAMRGRVSAVNAVFIGASNELGGLESGLTAAWWGPVASVVFGGCGTIVVVILVALIWPQIRRFGSLQDARPAEEPTAR